MTYTYIPKGVCSRKMTVELNDDHTIQAVRVEGGCNGNLQGISRLVVGMDAQEAIPPDEGHPVRLQAHLLSRPAGHSAGAGAAAGVSAMSQFFECTITCPEDPARLFDVAQGLAGRRNILKRGGTVKVKPFTETCRRLLFQCIAFAVLTALAAVLVWAFHAKLKGAVLPVSGDVAGDLLDLSGGPHGATASPGRSSGRTTVPTAPSPSPPPVSGSGTPPTTPSGSHGSSGTAASSARRSLC